MKKYEPMLYQKIANGFVSGICNTLKIVAALCLVAWLVKE